jgi:hypothetical protein
MPIELLTSLKSSILLVSLIFYLYTCAVQVSHFVATGAVGAWRGDDLAHDLLRNGQIKLNFRHCAPLRHALADDRVHV